MKICYIVGHYLPHIGGVENLFSNYAQGMKKAGHEIRVITSSSGGINGHTTYEGIDVYYYDWKIVFGHPIAKASDMKEHVRWADIVHTTTFTVANPARRIGKKYNIPVLITIHEVLGDKWYWIESNRIKALGYRIFEKYVCCKPYDYIHVGSNATLNDYIKYYGKQNRIKMIYDCIDDNIEEFYKNSSVSIKKIFKLSKGERTFLYFGRPGQSKGIFVLLNAIKMLVKNYGEIMQGIKFCFLISKEPAKQRTIFEREVYKSQLDKYVKIHDSLKRSDLFKVISQADYIVVPSITEGFGLCAAEACALHKNIICSDAGALPEVVSGKVISFKNMDSKDLEDKLMMVIKNGNNAFQYVEEKNFSRDKMLNEMEGLYNEIVALFQR